MKHKLESRLQGEISITSDMQMIPHLWQKVKEESEKVDLKLYIQKTKAPNIQNEVSQKEKHQYSILTHI